MIGSILCIILLGISSKYVLTLNYRTFLTIHRLFIIFIYIGAYIHKAWYIFIFGVSVQWFDKVFSLLNVLYHSI